MQRSTFLSGGLLLLLTPAGRPLLAQPPDRVSRDEALRALKAAASHFYGRVASHGGYVYYYSLNLQERWGEGKASADTIFVQPPGTPTVGLAYLQAHVATHDRFYLDAGRAAAEALVRGQLKSGGWRQSFDAAPGRTPGRADGLSSLDDGQTQAALQLLIRADQALDFQHAGIHEAARYGLDALLRAQFPNGAFPQVWRGAVTPQPVLPARFPDYDWKTEGRIKNYWDYYTLNDNLAGSVATVLIAAHEVYREDRYRAALAKLGDFLLLAQMPDPQPGWCQQYSYAMLPIWARKFEPPAVSGWESQDVLETLIRIARLTGDPKYLQPIPRALAYFRRSLLPDGRVARYYEFGINRPLYMDRAYQLTYADTDLPAHYGWKQPARFAAIERAYEAARQGAAPPPPQDAPDPEPEAHRIIRSLDPDGRWISTYAGERLVGQPKFAQGFRYLSSAVFARNVEVLSRYVAAQSK